jgi:hypothetical protein
MPILMPSLKNFLTRIMLLLLLLFPWSTPVMGVHMAMELQCRWACSLFM